MLIVLDDGNAPPSPKASKSVPSSAHGAVLTNSLEPVARRFL